MQNKKGFTLIELIVVIAIIAILAAIVMVKVSGYINKSKDAAMKGDMRSFMTNVLANYADGSDFSNACQDSAWVNVTKNFTLQGTCQALTSPGLSACCTQASAFCAVVSELSSNNHFCVDKTGIHEGPNYNCGPGDGPTCCNGGDCN